MKNNFFKKNNIYSLRKFKLGLASVTIGGIFLLTGGVAMASDNTAQTDSNVKLEFKIDNNKEDLVLATEKTTISEKNNIESIDVENVNNQLLENIKKDTKEENVILKEDKKQETLSINYKVIYVDEEGKTVHSEHHTVLSDVIEGMSEKEITVDFNSEYGFRLANNQEKSVTKIIKHNEKNIIEFRVTTKEDKIKEETKLFASSTPISNDAPYITIERYFGEISFFGEGRNNPNVTYTKNGDTIEIVYQMGLTRITADEVELTPDAELLGLKYDTVNNRITGSVTLGDNIEIRTYDIGLQKKGDSSIKTSADFKIQSHKGFVPRLDGTPKDGKYVRGIDYSESSSNTNKGSIKNISLIRSSLGEVSTNTESDSNVETSYGFSEFHERLGKPYDKLIYDADITVTPFGYYVNVGTIKDIKEYTAPYEARFTLVGLDDRATFGENTLSIKEFKQTAGSSGVEIELIDKTKDYPKKDYEPLKGGSLPPERSTPYLVRFKKLPNTAGKHFVEFKVVDNLGLEKNFRINITTFERSHNGALTIADVRFDNNKEYNNSGVDHVVIPRSTNEQILGTIVKNKDNSQIVPIDLPDWLEYDPNNNTLKKKEGRDLKQGIYTVDFKAIDGHFNEAGPNRTFTYEVSDVLNNIGHKVWIEGKTIEDIPVSFEGGTKIEKLKVVYNGDNASLYSSNKVGSINGYATKITNEKQTAEVFATYLNSNGQEITVRTTFTFEVKPNEEINNLELSVTNNTQTIKEGDTFQDMVVSVTEGAELIIDKTLLPDNLVYDESSKTFSGKGLYEGFYKIPIIAKKNGFVKTTELNLTIEPGEFTLKPIVIDVTVGEHLSEVLDLPKNVVLEYNTNYRDDGVEDDTDRFFRRFGFNKIRKKVSGYPNRVGTYVLGITGKRSSNGKTQTAKSTITINVRPIPHELTLTNKDQTVYIGDSIEEILINLSKYAFIEAVHADPNLNLYYDRSKNIITAKPRAAGTYTFDVISKMQKHLREELPDNEYGEEEKIETVTIIVKNRVDLELENIEVTVKDKMVEIPVNINVLDSRIDKSKVSLSTNYQNLPEGIEFDSIKKVFFGTPERAGEYTVTVYANYEGTEEIIGEKTITIKVIPLEPTIKVSNSGKIYEFGEKILPASITNSSHSKIAAYYLGSILNEDDISDYVSKEWGLKYDKLTKTISGTPKVHGNHQLRLKAILPAELGGTSDEILYEFTVLPESKISLEIENDRQFILQGDSIRNIKFINSDNTDVEFNVGSLPEGLQYNSESKTITGIPTKAGRYDLTVTAREKTGKKSITKTIALDVFYIPKAIVPKEPSKDPLVDVLTEGDTIISGKGVAGSVIVVRFPDGTSSENIIVSEEGTWTVSAPKQLNKGENITVKQTESGKEQSDAINTTVIPNLNNIPSKAITIEKVENNNGNIDVTFSDGTKITIPKGEKGDVGDRGRDGKDGKTPSIVTEEGKDEEGNSGLWIIIKDGDNNITSKSFIKYCGCKDPNSTPKETPIVPNGDTPKTPGTEVPETPNGDTPKTPSTEVPETPNGDTPKTPGIEVPETPNGEKLQVPVIEKQEKSNGKQPQVSDNKATKNYKLSNTGDIINDTVILGIITMLIALITISNRKRND